MLLVANKTCAKSRGPGDGRHHGVQSECAERVRENLPCRRADLWRYAPGVEQRADESIIAYPIENFRSSAGDTNVRPKASLIGLLLEGFQLTVSSLPGLPKQKGVVTYQIAQNRVSPTRHFWNEGAVGNTFRRCRNQFLYVVPPLLAGYLLMQWAVERYVV